MLRTEVNRLRIWRPSEASDPVIKVLRQISFLSRLPVVQHQPEPVALVPRPLLRAVGDVLAIRRIKRSRVARRVVSRDVLRLPSRVCVYWHQPQVVIRGRRFHLVVIRGVTDLLSIRRKGKEVLSTQRERRSVVITRRQVASTAHVGTGALACPIERSSTTPTTISRYNKDMRPLSFFVSIPVPVEQPIEDQRLDLGFRCVFHLLRITLLLLRGWSIAFRINIGREANVLTIRRPDGPTHFRGERS